MQDEDDRDDFEGNEAEARVPAMETPLDLAFERARNDPEETPAFYEALFAATIFLRLMALLMPKGRRASKARHPSCPSFMKWMMSPH